ncbi:hypothetical protein [Ruegeria sp. HKCCD8929]|uniref:hypothetical protein n=1 Tax=Ruegeria sp. HKCCD8929 TaxID=2683006 RepID=UPI001488CD15|nr:hypothetical protein [Ruegeria sp. HKCCD8929]
MTIETDAVVPPSITALCKHATKFSQALKLLSFDDDSDVGVTVAAERLSAAVGAFNDRLARPAKPDDGALADIEDRIAPAVDTLGTLVQVFSDDAASGAVSLPDMDDLAVMMGFLGQNEDRLFRVLELTPSATKVKSTPERAELVECLTSFGVPLAEVGLHPPTMIKVIIILVIVVILLRRRDAEALVITIVNVLVLIDRRGQGGTKLPGGSQPGGSQPGGAVTPGAPPAPPAPAAPVDPCAAKGEFRIIVGGSGVTEQAALADAMRNAFLEAARRCGPGCRPRALGMTNERATLIGDANNPFRTARRFIFRCRK